MTPHQQETKRRAEVMLAYAEGAAIESIPRHPAINESWVPNPCPHWDWLATDYRVKPQPTTRPWTAEDVPPLCWVRSNDDSAPHVVIGIQESGIELYRWHSMFLYPYQHLRLHCEYSTDLKTWRKCEVSCE